MHVICRLRSTIARMYKLGNVQGGGNMARVTALYLIGVEENGFHATSICNQITLLLQIHFRVSISHSHHRPR